MDINRDIYDFCIVSTYDMEEGCIDLLFDEVSDIDFIHRDFIDNAHLISDEDLIETVEHFINTLKKDDKEEYFENTEIYVELFYKSDSLIESLKSLFDKHFNTEDIKIVNYK